MTLLFVVGTILQWLGVVLAVVVGVAVLIVLIVIALNWKRRFGRQRKERVIVLSESFAASDVPIEKLLIKSDQFFNGEWVISENLGVIAEALVHSGHNGVAIRIHDAPKERVTPVAPLQVSFEPLALDEGAPRFDEVLKSLGSPHEAVNATPTPDIENADELALRWRKLRRSGRFWFVFINSAVFVFIAIQYLVNPRMPSGFAILAFMNGPLALYLAFRRRHPASENYAIPGGIRITTANRLARVFRRAGSVLIWQASTRWLIAADRTGTHFAPMTPAEAHLALAAWFSPCQGPSDEQMCLLYPKD